MVDYLCDVVVERGAEEYSLPILAALFQYRAYRLHESHVSHPVGLVQDYHSNVI
jgi:hypothetical protein